MNASLFKVYSSNIVHGSCLKPVHATKAYPPLFGNVLGCYIICLQVKINKSCEINVQVHLCILSAVVALHNGYI